MSARWGCRRPTAVHLRPFHQRLEIPGLWLEQATLDAEDRRLMNAPSGLAGHRCLGTMVLASGLPLARERKEQLQEAARTALQTCRSTSMRA